MADKERDTETPAPAPADDEASKEQRDIGGTDTGDGPESSETSGQFPADEVRETFVPEEPPPEVP